MKKKLLIALCLILIAMICGCVQTEDHVEIEEEFEIQGLTWRTIAYYYGDGIYREMYNDADNARLLEKARGSGANYLAIRVFYNATKNGSLVGNDEEAEEYLKNAIEAAHEEEMKVFLAPFVESMEFWGGEMWTLSEEEWTPVVLKWAEFAEDNDVEMYAPGVEMSLILGENESAEWLKEILPQIRERYSGIVTTAEHPYIGLWEVQDKRGAFANYDCIGMTIFPWKDYNGTSDIRGFDEYRADVEQRAEIMNYLAEKYGVNCTIAATLGMDWWHGEEPDPEIRAEGYGTGLDVLKEHNITGVFLHIWASERDHLGSNFDVEQMLRSRWTR
jgi:hypothetical protein